MDPDTLEIISRVVKIAGLLMLAIYGLGTMLSSGGKLGVNLKRASCPECGRTAPAVREPASMRQAVWGGWTCQSCGTQLDKCGHVIS